MSPSFGADDSNRTTEVLYNLSQPMNEGVNHVTEPFPCFGVYVVRRCRRSSGPSLTWSTLLQRRWKSDARQVAGAGWWAVRSSNQMEALSSGASTRSEQISQSIKVLISASGVKVQL